MLRRAHHPSAAYPCNASSPMACLPRDVTGHRPTSGRNAHQERPHHTGPTANFAVESFKPIVRAQFALMHRRKTDVRQCFLNSLLDLLRCLLQFHFPQLLNDHLGLFPSGFSVFLGMNRFEHRGHLSAFGAWRHGEDIPIKMDRTPLIFGGRKDLVHSLERSQSFVPNYQLGAAQSPRF